MRRISAIPDAAFSIARLQVGMHGKRRSSSSPWAQFRDRNDQSGRCPAPGLPTGGSGRYVTARWSACGGFGRTDFEETAGGQNMTANLEARSVQDSETPATPIFAAPVRHPSAWTVADF